MEPSGAARCFVAVLPPPALVAQLQALERPARAGLRWMAAHQWHVTLRFLGQVDPVQLCAAMDALADAGVGPVVASAGPCPTALGSAGRVWVLPVEGLGGLAEAVAGLTAGLAPRLGARAFRGHLTLARARRPEALRDLPAPPLEAEWLVQEVLAFSSQLLPSGAVHHRLGGWALPAR